MTYSTNYSVVDVKDFVLKGEMSAPMISPFGSVSQVFTFDVPQMNDWKILKPIENSIIFTREELEARDRERDRRVAAEAWDAGGSSVYDNTKPDGGCEFDSTQHLKDKETYLNSLINK